MPKSSKLLYTYTLLSSPASATLYQHSLIEHTALNLSKALPTLSFQSRFKFQIDTDSTESTQYLCHIVLAILHHYYYKTKTNRYQVVLSMGDKNIFMSPNIMRAIIVYVILKTQLSLRTKFYFN